jgi:hypothetical protein
MHVLINVKSPNNISKWQMGFNSAFKGLIVDRSDYPMTSVRRPQASHNLLSRFVCWRRSGKNLNVTHAVTSSIMWVLFRFYTLDYQKIYFCHCVISLSYLEDHGGSADSAGVNVEYCPVLTSVHDETNRH